MYGCAPVNKISGTENQVTRLRVGGLRVKARVHSSFDATRSIGGPTATLATELPTRASLFAALVVLCDCHNAGTSWGAPAGLGPGERQLAEGLGRALEVRRVINQAVAHLAGRHQVSLDDAFEQLRVDARSRGTNIARTARRLLIS